MVNITEITPILISTQVDYNPEDENLISSTEIDTQLTTGSYIEYSIYDLNNNLLYLEENYTLYTVINDGIAASSNTISKIQIDPEQDLTTTGFNQGTFNVYYNFFNPQVGSNIEPLFISEISSDRTELRLDSNILEDARLLEQTQTFINKREESDYFVDFYLNFGENNLVLANNIQTSELDATNNTILVKLYEPLPSNFNLKDELWLITSIEDPLAYNVEFIEEPIVIQDSSPLNGPNFNLDVKDQINNSTLELNYNELITSPLSSSQNQFNSLLEEKEVKINIDFTDFEDFIHFSSAKVRLDNFYYKMQLIENYSSSLSTINTQITGSTSSSFETNESKTLLQNNINDIITNFDKYEYYLYYESGSYAWPKTNSTIPYQNATIGSNAVLNWFGSTNEASPLYGGRILSSSLYDNNNKDNLLFTIPEYLRDDSDNYPYELFINMVAQHYDNIWIYFKDVTQKFNADNRLNFGISKDLVASAIRDFGIKLYQNNFSSQDLYTAFLGLTPEGGLFPFPNITGSLPTPSGYEYIDTLISASNDVIPLDDVNKSLYKRIYHNLPYLLKKKGTIPGLRALITSYGIPDTILRISEFGGKDKVNSNDWDYYYNKFNYKFDTNGTNFISSSWDINSTWGATNNKPSALEFRFKAEQSPPTNYSQSLWTNETSTLTIQYTGSGLTSGSYNGSIKDPYYQYANLTYYPSSSDLNTSASVYLPFFNEGWWSVLINSSSNGFELFAKNKISDGNDGTEIGFESSSSITSAYDGWSNGTISYFGTGSLYSNFSGSYQEIRYYKNAISESIFDDYVMNPLSFEGNNINTSPNELTFRAALGSELNRTTTTSTHPKITGSWTVTHSFSSNSSFNFDTPPTYSANTEYYFLDQPAVGIKNRITDKIRIENDVIPSGDTLSPFRSLTQKTAASASYTPNINLLEVAFSPQNEINDDIIGQLGHFNIGDYIGDPRYRSSSLNSYLDLDRLRDDYFEKYLTNYNLVDFIRLIKYFDNSLFKMIKDFVPARTSLASGIVIKQHLLERNRYPHVQATPTTTLAKYGKSGSIHWNTPLDYKDITLEGTVNPQWNNYEAGKIVNPSGGPGGVFNIFNSTKYHPSGSEGSGPNNIYNVTQSWNETYPTLSGSTSLIHDSQDEFYNGEFSGSNLLVTDQNLNPDCDPYKKIDPKAFPYGVRIYSASEYNFSTFIDENNHPTDGFISIWYNDFNNMLPPPR